MRHQAFGAMRCAAMAGALLLAVSPPAHTAEQPGLVRYTVSAVLQNLNNLSGAYLEYVASHEKDGTFELSLADISIMVYRLGEFQKSFAGLSDDEALEPRLSKPETRTQIQSALRCDLCGAAAPKSRRDNAPQTPAELRELVTARVDEIIGLFKAQKSPATKDQVLLLERHLFYLRQITIAYL